MNFIANFFRNWKEKRKAKRWREEHLEFLIVRLKEDSRWLAGSGIVCLEQLALRHEQMADPDNWYKTSHEHVNVFRDKLVHSFQTQNLNLYKPHDL